MLIPGFDYDSIDVSAGDDDGGLRVFEGRQPKAAVSRAPQAVSPRTTPDQFSEGSPPPVSTITSRSNVEFPLGGMMFEVFLFRKSGLNSVSVILPWILRDPCCAFFRCSVDLIRFVNITV